MGRRREKAPGIAPLLLPVPRSQSPCHCTATRTLQKKRTPGGLEMGMPGFSFPLGMGNGKNNLKKSRRVLAQESAPRAGPGGGLPKLRGVPGSRSSPVSDWDSEGVLLAVLDGSMNNKK